MIVRRTNQHLDRSAAIVSAELTRSLKRPVSIGRLDASIDMAFKLATKGTLPAGGIGVDASDIHLGTRPSEVTLHGGGQIATVPKATIQLTSIRPIRMVVTLKKPKLILARRQNGEFFIADLFKSKPMKVDDASKPLDIRVDIEDAAVSLRDYSLAGYTATPRVTELVHVQGSVDAGGLLATRGRFSGEARHATQQGNVVGRNIGIGLVIDHPVIGRDQTTRVHITGRDADINYWLPLASLAKNSISINGGRGTADINITTTGKKVNVSGDIRVAGTSIRLPETKIPAVTNINATINLGETSVAFSGSASLAGIPLALNGVVDLRGNTSGALIVAAKPCTTRKAATILRIPMRAVRGVALGDAHLKRALIEWKGRTFTVDADADVRGIRIKELKTPINVSARIHLTDKNATLSGLTETGRLRIPIKAKIQLPSGLTNFEYACNRVRLRDIQDVISKRISATDFDVMADIHGDGTYNPAVKNAITVRGALTGTARALNNGAEARIQADIVADSNQLKFVRGNILASGGMAKLSGTLNYAGSLALEGTFAGIDLATSGLVVGIPFDNGSASGRLTIDGTFSKPILNLSDLVVLNPRVIAENRVLQADALRCEEVRWVSDASGDLAIDLLKPLYVSWLPADVVVTGRIRGRTDLPQFDVSITGKHVDIARLVPMIRGDLMPWALDILHESGDFQSVSKAFGWREADWDVSGDVGDLTARVSGTTDQLRIAGSVQLEAIGLGEYRIGSASTQFLWQNQALELSNIVANVEAGRVTGDVRITNDAKVTGLLATDHLNIGILANRFSKDAAVGGSVSARIGIAGTLQQPTLSGQLLVRDALQYGASRWMPQKPFGISVERVSSADGPYGWNIHLTPVETSDYGAQWSISNLDWRGGERTLRISAAVADLSVDELRKLGKVLPVTEFTPAGWTDKIPDNLNAEISTAAEIMLHHDGDRWIDPTVSITAVGKNPALGQARFDLLKLDARLEDRVWTIRDASLDSEKSAITGRGTLRLPEGDADKSYGMDLVFESIQPSMDLFKPFIGDVPLIGQWDTVTIVAKGTTDRPKIQGTIDGNGLAWKTPSSEQIKLDVVRVNARLEASSAGDLYLFVDEALAKHLDEEIRIVAGVPISLDAMRILPDKPIEALKMRASNVQLKTLASALQWKSMDVAGELNGEVSVSGSLNKPMLGGEVAVTDASAALTSQVSKRQMLSAMKSGNLTFALSGNTATVTRGEILLASPPSQPRLSGGAAKLSGSVRLDNLEDFTRLFQKAEANQPVARLRGQYALTVEANALRPEINNLTAWLEVKDLKGTNGLGEALSAQIDGMIQIKGDLLNPIIATDENQPLLVRDAIFRVPRPSVLAATPKTVTVNPQLKLGLKLATDARAILFASTTTGLELRGRGDVTVGGSMVDTTVVANLITTGGQLRYPLARLDVNRGGDVRVNWSKLKSTATLAGVVAEGRITGIADSNGTRAVDSRFANPVLANTGASTSQTYRVLAKLTGVVDIGAVGGTEILQQLSLDAEPSLTRNQIVDLLGARRQFDLIASGDTDQAVREFGSRIFETGLVPSVFAPLTNSVRDSLRLDALDVTYGIDGLATFRVVRRFEEPFDRFSVDLTRSLSTRSQAGRQLPYSYGVNYELFTFRTRGRYQPRFLLGAAQTSTQRDTLFFIRGTVNY